jgi:hypothetical protein
VADAILGGIVINEIHAQPSAGGGTGFDTDGNGTVSALDEYVELLNTSDEPIDISGLQLWDPGTGNWFTFPSGSVLEPGGFALVVVGVQSGGSLPSVPSGSLAFDAGRSSAVLNNAGDNLYLVDPDSNSFIAASYGNWPVMDPTDPDTWGVATGSTAGLAGFPSDATQIGEGEDFGAVNPGSSNQRVPDGGDTFRNDLGATPGFENPLCFTGGTRLLTPAGWRRVEALRPGDTVSTAEGGTARILWCGARRIRPAEIAADPQRWPVEIAPGALGPGCPERRIVLSAQHRVLVAGALALRLNGGAEGLVPAQALCGLPGIRRILPEATFTYHHILCASHEVLIAEGLAAESLLPGPFARAAIAPQTRAELRELLGEAWDSPVPARDLLQPGRIKLAIRKAAGKSAGGSASRRNTARPRPRAALRNAVAKA